MESDPIKPASLVTMRVNTGVSAGVDAEVNAEVNAAGDDADRLDSPGTEMTRKLKDADRAAVDMLFDRITSAQAKGGSSDAVVPVANAVSDTNLFAVEKLLNMLAIMPAAEPPADLSTRTLQRIASATGAALPTAPGAFLNPDQPLA